LIIVGRDAKGGPFSIRSEPPARETRVVILIGAGANLPGPAGEPAATLRWAFRALEARGVALRAISPFYATAPVPPSGQPDFVNAVAELGTSLAPGPLLELLHAIEAQAGRVRDVPNAARTLDLDLLAWHDRVASDRLSSGTLIQIPHPRLHERAFVLHPLVDIAPDWRHPRLGRTAVDLLAALPPGQRVRRIDRESA
jgi:2-amino-4-hydroxy-6-hydroxymethyldihydropteridine diphosphokinase